MVDEVQKDAGNKLCDRIAILAREHGQAGLARKGGTTRRNVHRYISSTNPPAEFLANLSRSLGVNPGWLLLGTAPMYIGDAGGRSDEELDLMSAINAADAAQDMKLHTLTKLPELSSLKDVSDRLKTMEDRSHKVAKQATAYVEVLLKKAREVGVYPTYDRALPILRTAERLLALVDSSETKINTLRMLGITLHNKQLQTEAAAYWQKALAISLLQGPKIDLMSLNLSFNMVIDILDLGCLQLALEICIMTGLLYPKEHKSDRAYSILNMVRGECLVALGEFSEGAKIIQQTTSNTKHEADTFAAYRALILFWSGRSGVKGLDEQYAGEGHLALIATEFATFMEVTEDLEAAARILSKAKESGYAISKRIERKLSLITQANKDQKQDKARVAKAITEVIGQKLDTNPARQFETMVMAAQLARLTNDRRGAKLAAEAHKYFIDNCTENSLYTVGAIMTHIRSTLFYFKSNSTNSDISQAAGWAINEANRRYQSGMTLLDQIPVIADHLWPSYCRVC